MLKFNYYCADRGREGGRGKKEKRKGEGNGGRERRNEGMKEGEKSNSTPGNIVGGREKMW